MYSRYRVCNSHFPTLLYLYKLAAWTITLHAIQIMYRTRFRVVQLMYGPLRGFYQSLPNLVVGVQTCRLDHYTSDCVGNVHNKFQGCTVDVRATTGFYQSLPNLVVGVHICRLDHYTSDCVVNVHVKFQVCTADVQAATGFLTIST